MNSGVFLYGVGTALVIAAVVLGAKELGVPENWILIVGLLVAGLGIRGAARHVQNSQNEHDGQRAAISAEDQD